MTEMIALDLDDIRLITAFAAQSAAEVLPIFDERALSPDSRPRDAVEAAWAFARGGVRGKALRDTAWAALRAAQESKHPAAEQVARAAMSAASAAYLHPLARSTQVRHILGAVAHAVRAREIVAGEGADRDAALCDIERAVQRAQPGVAEILRRYPRPPAGGGRTGELLRILDHRLRGPAP